MTRPNLAVWLMPSEEDASRIEPLINQLAKKHDAPTCEPHLTLLSGKRRRNEKPWEQIPYFEPFKLPVLTIDFWNLYTKTLFFRFPKSQRLKNLIGLIREKWNPTGNKDFDPHLSLLYANLSLLEKQSLAESMSSPLKSVNFDRLTFVEYPERIESPKDVSKFLTLPN